MIESFPLCWPEGWKRTPVNLREKSQFRRTTNDVRNFLKEEVRRLGADRLIISTNMPTRLDGEFYASARNPEDPGVAVYFTYKKKPMCFACDRHPSLRENLHAIAATINALRGIERWGASDMMERAFSGFAQLPAASWRSVLELGESPTRAEVEYNYLKLARLHHPDKGGDAVKMAEINKARDAALKEL